MMLDTAMKFLGQGQGQTSDPSQTLEIMEHLRRFLSPSHHLMAELKERFVQQILDSQRIGKGDGKAVHIFCIHTISYVLHCLSYR